MHTSTQVQFAAQAHDALVDLAQPHTVRLLLGLPLILAPLEQAFIGVPHPHVQYWEHGQWHLVARGCHLDASSDAPASAPAPKAEGAPTPPIPLNQDKDVQGQVDHRA
jgi:hypothetical protein